MWRLNNENNEYVLVQYYLKTAQVICHLRI
jgi:hypothetical protein